MSCGILYLACGYEYYKKALYSVKSLRLHMPDVHVTLVCDQNYTLNDPAASDKGRPYFDNFIDTEHDPVARYRSKVRAFNKTPYDKTIFLDADTIVLDNFSEIYRCLDIFDCGASLNIHRGEIYKLWDIPCLSMFSSSTFAYRKNNIMEGVFSELEIEYDAALKTHPQIGDQEVLSYCIIKNEAKYWVMSEEYNFHLMHIGRAWKKIKIATSHEEFIKNISHNLNFSNSERVWLPSEMKILIDTYFDVYFGNETERKIISITLV